MGVYDDSVAKELHLKFLQPTGNYSGGIPTYQNYDLVENDRVNIESMSLTMGALEGTQFQLGSYVIPEMQVTFAYNGKRYKDKIVRVWLTIENDMTKNAIAYYFYSGIPSFSIDNFYEYDEVENKYVLLEEQPDDWESNWHNYYAHTIYGLIFGKVYQEKLSDDRQNVTITIRNILYDTFDTCINWNGTFFNGVPCNRENNGVLNMKMRTANDIYKILYNYTICYSCGVYNKAYFSNVITSAEVNNELDILRYYYADFTPYGDYSDNLKGYLPLSISEIYPSKPNYVPNKFYYKSTYGATDYIPLTSQNPPSDWNTNWNTYYEYVGTRIKYIAQLNYNARVPDGHSGSVPSENEYTLDYEKNKNIYLSEVWRQFGELAGVHWIISKPLYENMADINANTIKFKKDVYILPVRFLSSELLVPSNDLKPYTFLYPSFAGGRPLPNEIDVISQIPYYISCIYDETAKTKYQGVRYKDSGVFLIDDNATTLNVSSYNFDTDNIFFDCGFRAANSEGQADGFYYYSQTSILPDFPDCAFDEHIKSLRGENFRFASSRAGGYGYFYKDYLCNLDKIIYAVLDCIHDPSLLAGQLISIELPDGNNVTMPLISCEINGINVLRATYKTTAFAES